MICCSALARDLQFVHSVSSQYSEKATTTALNLYSYRFNILRICLLRSPNIETSFVVL